jgi:hypothetical protein
MIKMENSGYDLEYLKIGMEDIQNYLLSEELFWPVSGRPSGDRPFFLKMTIGNLLLSEHRLATLSDAGLLSPADAAEFSKLQSGIQAVQMKWRVAWERKASREYDTRFNQWGKTLGDLKSDRYQNAPFYKNEVRLRVLLELLVEQIPDKARHDLAPLDKILRQMFKSGEFIWGAELAPGFPKEKYWYLYGGV